MAIVGILLAVASTTGACELLDQLRQTRRSAAPPTVYRTLDFLLDQGLIHKVQRLSAFAHAAQFLICRACKRVVEMQDHHVSAALAHAAKEAGFSVSSATIEAEGLCRACETVDCTRTN